MTLTTVALLAVTSLCMFFAETRWVGMVAIVVFGYLYPLPLLVALTVAAVVACTFHYF
jgi:hypothetical protein